MSNTTPTPSTPKVPKPKQPADPAGQTTTIPAVDADSTPWADDLDDNITPTPKKKRKLPRWGWSVVGGIIAAILYWVARDLLLFVSVVVAGAVLGLIAHTTIRNWQQELEWKKAGQPTAPTTQFATKFSSGWRLGLRLIVSVLFGALGAVIGSIVVWQVAALIMKSTDFLWEGWMTYSLAALLGALMFIVFGILGNKLATKLL